MATKSVGIFKIASGFMAPTLNITDGSASHQFAPMHWKIREKTIDLTQRGMIMGILNVTPDSFSDGGVHADISSALAHARQMIDEGASIIDVGGESTRPGAAPVSAELEIARTLPIIAALRETWDGLISIDASKASVAAAALKAGADIVNDVTGLEGDAAMPGLCAESGCGVVLMHMLGQPCSMQQNPIYEDVVSEVRNYFVDRLESITAQGIHPDSVCFDPGIGFGKTCQHNLELLRNLDKLAPGDRPLLLGVSLKSFIARILDKEDFTAREWPTVAITSFARRKGVAIHRVHHVEANLQAMRMTEAILGIY